MNKKKNKQQKFETTEDLVEWVLSSVIGESYFDNPFCEFNYSFEDRPEILQSFKTLPEMPKKEALTALVKESAAFKEFMEGAVEDIADGLIYGVENEIDYRKQEEKERIEEEKEEARFAKEQAQLAKQGAKKNKQKQLLAKTLTDQQKKALKEIGITL